MAKTASFMSPLGTIAPDFCLYDVISKEPLRFFLNDIAYKGTVVMFLCNHCPFVKHINNEIVKIANEYQDKGIRFFAINSNDVENYPDDSPENMAKVAKELKYPFPYLFDETQEVAKAYNATCTPDFFIYNHDDKLVYRGQLDGSRPGNDIAVTGESVRYALDCILALKSIDIEQKPSIGCNIKWKSKEYIIK